MGESSGSKVLSIIMGVIVVVLGVWCVMTPVSTFGTVSWIAGFAMIIEGVGKIMSFFTEKKVGKPDVFLLVGGILSTVLGVVLLVSLGMRWAYDLFVAYLVACWVIVAGITNIVRAFNLRNLDGSRAARSLGSNWGWVLALGILLLVVGIWGFFNPVMVMVALGWQIGFAVIAGGVNLIVSNV